MIRLTSDLQHPIAGANLQSLTSIFSRIPTWVGVALAVVLFIIHLAYYAYIDVDDAYISYRYALNFAHGAGLLYNPGEAPAEGYSNFLWVVVLAGSARLGIDIPIAAKLIGSGLAIATLIGSAYLLYRQALSKYLIWAAGLWLAASGPYAMWSISGMESALLAAASLLALIVLEREERTARGIASSIALLLVTLTRAEGAIFFVATWSVRAIAHLSHNSQRSLREDAMWTLAFIIPFGLYLLWRISYYGDWIPITVHAKAGGGYLYHTLRGTYYLINFMIEGGTLLIVLVAAAALLRMDRSLVKHSLAGLIGYIALIVIAGGDWMPQFRFFAPILPWLFMLAAMGLDGLSSLGHLRRMRTFSALVVILLFGLNAIISINQQDVKRIVRDFSAPIAGAHFTAAWLREHSQPGDSLALVDAGVLAYETDLRIIDMIGLNDPYIARLPPRLPNGIALGYGFGKWDTDYVLAQEPTFVQVHLSRTDWEQGKRITGWVGTDELINDPRFLAAYAYIDVPGIDGIFMRIVP